MLSYPCLSVSIRGKTSIQAVEIALQDDRRGGLVHLLLALVAANVALDEKLLRLRGCEPLVERLDGRDDGFAQHAYKFLHLQRRGTVAAVHIARHADDDELDFLLAQNFLEPRQKIRERRRRD